MNKVLYFLMYINIFIFALVPSKFKIRSIPFNGDAFLALIILVYIIFIIVNKEMRDKFINAFKYIFKDYTLLFLILYAGIMILSILYSTDKKLALRESVRFSTYLALFFIIKYEITDRTVIEKLMKFHIINVVIVCVYGIIGLAFSFDVDISHGIYRIQSTFENPNNFAMYLILSIFPIATLAIDTKKRKDKIIYLIITLLIIVSITLTGSRNALLGLIIGFAFLMFFYSWKFITWVGGIGIITVFIPSVRTRILKIGDTSQNMSRIKLWRVALDIIRDHPILGVGNGNYSTFYQRYKGKYSYINYNPTTNVHPHNIFLKVQCELGIFGLAVFLGLISSILFSILRFIKFVKNSFVRFYYKGFIISFVVFIMMNMIDNFFSAPKVIIYFWMFIAISQSNAFKSDLKVDSN